jgi:proline iminopeptidase
MTNWGATDTERIMPLPGDKLIPGGRGGATMATTISAPPAAVWPWLVQMGCDRAGFYSWDRLDNHGRPSAERIHPEWQDVAVGSRLYCVPDGSVWFDVALLERERTFVLRSSLTLPSGRPFNPTLRPQGAFSDSTWGFHLRPIGDGGTRLLVRGWQVGRPRGLIDTANWLFWEPAHWVMQTKQFAELRRRAESTPAPDTEGAARQAAVG